MKMAEFSYNAIFILRVFEGEAQSSKKSSIKNFSLRAAAVRSIL